MLDVQKPVRRNKTHSENPAPMWTLLLPPMHLEELFGDPAGISVRDGQPNNASALRPDTEHSSERGAAKHYPLAEKCQEPDGRLEGNEWLRQTRQGKRDHLFN